MDAFAGNEMSITRIRINDFLAITDGIALKAKKVHATSPSKDGGIAINAMCFLAPARSFTIFNQMVVMSRWDSVTNEYTEDIYETVVLAGDASDYDNIQTGKMSTFFINWSETGPVERTSMPQIPKVPMGNLKGLHAAWTAACDGPALMVGPTNATELSILGKQQIFVPKRIVTSSQRHLGKTHEWVMEMMFTTPTAEWRRSSAEFSRTVVV
jgi:hypothetical protein